MMPLLLSPLVLPRGSTALWQGCMLLSRENRRGASSFIKNLSYALACLSSIHDHRLSRNDGHPGSLAEICMSPSCLKLDF